MFLPQDQQIELDGFLRELEKKKPNDFLQFAANYFNGKLGEQRAFIKNQEGLAASKGIRLFPESPQLANQSKNYGRGSSTAAIGDEDVLFKSPFIDHDPHSKHINDSITEGSREKNESSIFKGDFDVGQESHKSLQNPLDPKSPEGRSFSSMPRPSIANPEPLPVNFNAQRRTSVSAETLKPDHFNNWKPGKYTEKTPEQLKGLLEAVGKNFLFNKLDADSKTLVLSYLEEKFVKAGEVIIRQGDEGDYFYIVEKGTVDFYLDGKKVNTHNAGCSFGELALMYNSPRAATAIATTDCTLWALDRLTFRRILLSGSFKKRILYDDFLKSMPLLKSLSTYDRAKLADALNTEVYEAGDIIIKEGDTGENFYLIEYGEVEVSKKDQGAIGLLKTGDYFGEVALLTDLPRQATIRAKTRTKVATLGKSGFQRLLGPAVEVLKLNDPTRTVRK